MKLYSEITDSECTMYKGSTLRFMYIMSSHSCIVGFESVKDGKHHKQVYYTELDEDKMYKCYEYERTSGSGITYKKIAILNFD